MQLQHNPKNRVVRGVALNKADKVMVMVHGRGASAESILSLSEHITQANVAYLAPQATQNTWYPHSFMAPVEENEPGLSSALTVLDAIVKELHQEQGFGYGQIYLLGFSQGACLSLEYAARNPQRYGGIFGLSGGLIGPEGKLPDFQGDFDQTPVFLGCSDVDFHIPKERVLESERVFKGMKANVLAKLYKNLPHTVNDDELNIVNQILVKATF